MRRARGAAAILGGAALAIVPSIATAASSATLTLQAMEPSYGPVTVTSASGTKVTAKIGYFRLGVTPAAAPGVTVHGYCDDPLVSITQGKSYAVELRGAEDASDLASPGYNGVGWLLRSSDRLIAAAPNPGLEAAALQVAVWQMGGRVPAASRTGNAALDARVDALRQTALTASAPRPETATAAAATACAETGTVRVDITGAPGSTAVIRADHGATVSSASAVLDMSGTAHVDVRSATAGPVSVHVDLSGGRMVRAARPAGARGPQETMLVMPGTSSVDVPVLFTDCGLSTGATETPVTPTEVPTTPAPVTPAGNDVPVTKPETPLTPTGVDTPTSSARAPHLVVRKTARAAVAAGGRIVYTITVRNTGGGTATGVHLRDAVPEGTYLTGTPAGAHLLTGSLVWAVGGLAPGASRTVRVSVRVPNGDITRVCNTAVATGEGGLMASGRACTRVARRPRAIVPAVTG